MTGFGKDGRGQILYYRDDISLGALATYAVANGVPFTLDEDFRILSMDVWAVWQSVQDADDEKLVMLHLASGDLSATEVQECLSASPAHPDDRPPIEHSHRPVWPLGLFTVPAQFTANNHVGYLNGTGHAHWSKRWTFDENVSFRFCVHTEEALNTGSSVDIFAKIYGVWVK